MCVIYYISIIQPLNCLKIKNMIVKPKLVHTYLCFSLINYISSIISRAFISYIDLYLFYYSYPLRKDTSILVFRSKALNLMYLNILNKCLV